MGFVRVVFEWGGGGGEERGGDGREGWVGFTLSLEGMKGGGKC